MNYFNASLLILPQMSNTTASTKPVFNIDNNHKCFLSIKSPY